MDALELRETARDAGRSRVDPLRSTSHAAATYSHVNQRKRDDIALQALPTDETFKQPLGKGVDLPGRGRGLRSRLREMRKAPAVLATDGGTCGRVQERDSSTLGYGGASHPEDCRLGCSRAAMDTSSPQQRSRASRAQDIPSRHQLLESAHASIGGLLLHVRRSHDNAPPRRQSYRARVDSRDRRGNRAARNRCLRETLIIVSADHSKSSKSTAIPAAAKAAVPIKSYEQAREHRDKGPRHTRYGRGSPIRQPDSLANGDRNAFR